MKNITKYVFVLIAMFCCSSAFAQSTVYFFVRSVESAEVKILKNGNEIFELRGPVKKTLNHPSFKIPHVSYQPAYRKCRFKEEGKVLFSVDFAFTNVGTGDVRKLAAEIQLNLEEGSVHYIQLAFKGLNDIQFKELTEKEAAKLLKDKKTVELPEYVEE